MTINWFCDPRRVTSLRGCKNNDDYDADLSSVWCKKREATAGLWMSVADDEISVDGVRDRTWCPRVEFSTPGGQNLSAVDGDHLHTAAPLVAIDERQTVRAAHAHVSNLHA